jgi:hypothetical protein
MKVVIHDAPILRTVFTMARVCPSSTANEQLNDGQNIHKNIVP